jgi:hypothetical protein
LPDHTNVYPTFHVSELKRHVPNNAELYPSRELQRPGPIITDAGAEEWEIEKIIDKRTRRRGNQFLVRWRGYGPDADVWVPGKELEDTSVLQEYQETHTDDALMSDEDVAHSQHEPDEDIPHEV